jgi:alanine dehydrogenase
MRIGIPRETKDGEHRVGLTPDAAGRLARSGHDVAVERGAGAGCGFGDAEYAAQGARIVGSAAEVFEAGLVVKVKELQPDEFRLPRRGQILFAYLHLAPDPPLLDAVLDCGVTGIAFETVRNAAGRLPLLEPMSRIAGALAVQTGAWMLNMANGGSGVLLASVPGATPARVAVIGAGASGACAIAAAAGLGASVVALDVDAQRLEEVAARHPGRVETFVSSPQTLEREVLRADLVIGALLVPGKLAPKLISRDLMRRRRPGSAFIDIGIDQGGISETSRPTSHSQPFYVDEGVVHYCVPNMPAACARTASIALAEATLPYVEVLARRGLEAVRVDAGLREGLQVHEGRVTHAGLAKDTGRALHAFA